MRGRYVLAALAAFSCSSAALAQGKTYACAQGLQLAALASVSEESTRLSEQFKAAFNGMPLDKATSTISTVGATLVGHSMANEVSASVDGLRNLALLRDQFADSDGRAVVLAQLSVAMREASNRMRRLSIAYGTVSRMAKLKDVEVLAASGMAFADKLSREWVCEQ